ncbi:MAG: M48 family metallopeptidase [Candidatus Paceibacterota bacterium]|jgi:heat shock protein HtpX
MTLYTQKSSNIRKTFFLMFFFMVFVILIGWIFGQAYDSPDILYIAVLISVFMSFGSYWWSDKIVTKMAHAKPIEHSENPELYHIVENLCITAGLLQPKIYLINEAQPNAFATGRDQKHAVIAVTSGLLEKLDRSEIEGVISHELSHIGNRDMLLMTVTVVLAGFIAIISDLFRRGRLFGGRRSSDDNGIQGIMMIVAIIVSILAPLAATLIRLAVSRKREFLADSTGALITRYPEGLASALEKIAKDENPMPSATNATAHLYIASPFRGKQALSGLTKLFMTHPPIEERVRRLRETKV